MRTDQLITLLAADLKPVDPTRISRTMIIAVAIGMAAAFGGMLLIFGLRSEMLDARNLRFLSIKLLFALAVVVAGSVFLARLARPGAQSRNYLILIFMPFAAITGAAVVALGSAHLPSWTGVIIGRDSLTCLPAIPLLAVLPFAVLIWALRTGAPTDGTHAGEIAGFVAGGLGALACAFPCADESLPAIALWYGLPIGICAAVGAKLGPSLLRW